MALGKGCCRVHRPHSKNKLARSYQVELLSYLICKRKFVYLLISLPIKQYFFNLVVFFLLQTPCRQKPCGDNGDCFPDFRLNTYSCKCHPGFAGIYCERRGNKWERFIAFIRKVQSHQKLIPNSYWTLVFSKFIIFFMLCYIMLYYAMSCHVMSIAILVISFHVVLCFSNYLFLFLFFKKPEGWGGGGKVTLLFST